MLPGGPGGCGGRAGCHGCADPDRDHPTGRRLDGAPGFQFPQGPGDRSGIQAALRDLDPLMQGRLAVAGQHGDDFLGDDRPCVHLERGQVHRAPGLGDAGGQRVADAVPAGEGRKQGGVGVQDAIREGPVDLVGHDGPEPRHRHQVDLVRHQRGGDGRRIARAVKVGPEAPEGRPIDQFRRGAVLLGQAEAGAGTVRKDGGDGEPGLEHRLQNRPGTRDKDREAHPANLVGTHVGPRGRSASLDHPRRPDV